MMVSIIEIISHEIYTHLIINHRNIGDPRFDFCYRYYAERYVEKYKVLKALHAWPRYEFDVIKNMC